MESENGKRIDFTTSLKLPGKTLGLLADKAVEIPAQLYTLKLLNEARAETYASFKIFLTDITSKQIKDKSITGKDLNDMGATEGQVLQWINNEIGWAPTTLNPDGTSTNEVSSSINTTNNATILKLLAGTKANKLLKLDADANLILPENKIIFKDKSSIHFKSDSGNREFSLSNPAGLLIFRDETDDRVLFQINELGDVNFHGNINLDNSKLLTILGQNVCLSDGTHCKAQASTTGQTTSTPTNYVISNNSIDTGKIIDGSISTADLSSNAITSEKIEDASITSIDLAANSVNASKIQDGSISLAKFDTVGIGSVLVGTGTGVTGVSGQPGQVLSINNAGNAIFSSLSNTTGQTNTLNLQKINSSYTILAADMGKYFLIDSPTLNASITVTLPAISSINPGQQVIIQKIDATSLVNIQSNTSDFIQTANNTTYKLNGSGESITLAAYSSGNEHGITNLGQ